jgi:hypothetical protein
MANAPAMYLEGIIEFGSAQSKRYRYTVSLIPENQPLKAWIGHSIDL